MLWMRRSQLAGLFVHVLFYRIWCIVASGPHRLRTTSASRRGRINVVNHTMN